MRSVTFGSSGNPEASTGIGGSRVEGAAADDGATVVSVGSEGVGGAGRGRMGAGGRARSTVASKRLRLLLLHGNSSAASLLLQARGRDEAWWGWGLSVFGSFVHFVD